MPQLVGFIVFAAYVLGIWKFWRGYTRTNFNPSLPTRVALSLLWPVLLITNSAYRQNFRKALKSGR
jgi:hypothetical protein